MPLGAASERYRRECHSEVTNAGSAKGTEEDSVMEEEGAWSQKPPTAKGINNLLAAASAAAEKEHCRSRKFLYYLRLVK